MLSTAIVESGPARRADAGLRNSRRGSWIASAPTPIIGPAHAAQPRRVPLADLVAAHHVAHDLTPPDGLPNTRQQILKSASTYFLPSIGLPEVDQKPARGKT